MISTAQRRFAPMVIGIVGIVIAISLESVIGIAGMRKVGRFVFFDLGGATEECVEVLAVDPVNQTFDAVVTRDHSACAIRPCIWPTPVLMECNDLVFDIKAVAAPDPGADLTVVIQT